MQTTMIKLSALLVLALPATIQASENTETANPIAGTSCATEMTAVSTVILQRQQTPELDSTEQATVATEMPTFEAQADKSTLSEDTDTNTNAVADAINALVKPLAKSAIKKNVTIENQQEDVDKQVTPCTSADCEEAKKLQLKNTNTDACQTTTTEAIS